jgi:hypothetical protein
MKSAQNRLPLFKKYKETADIEEIGANEMVYRCDFCCKSILVPLGLMTFVFIFVVDDKQRIFYIRLYYYAKVILGLLSLKFCLQQTLALLVHAQAMNMLLSVPGSSKKSFSLW